MFLRVLDALIYYDWLDGYFVFCSEYNQYPSKTTDVKGE